MQSSEMEVKDFWEMKISENYICSLSSCLHSIGIPPGEIALHIMHFSTPMKRNFTKPKGNIYKYNTQILGMFTQIPA